ncbi:MAG: tetratricopeptide repeat protein [Spirochaetaceae bacterium]
MITLTVPLSNRTELRAWYKRVHNGYEKVLYQMQRDLTELLAEADMHPTVKYRIKSLDSLYEKARRRVASDDFTGDTFTVTDFIGIRVVCPFIEDIRHCEQLIEQNYEVVEREQKGAEYSFQEFGYESVHCLVKIPQHLCEGFNLGGQEICEIQLRTILQDAWAEVEHELVYKAEFTPFDEPLRRKLAALNANLSLSDIVFQEIRDYQRQLHLQLKRRRRSFWATVQEAMSGDPGTFAARETSIDEDVPSTPGSTPADVPEEIVTSMIPGGDSVDNLLLRALNAHNRKSFDEAITLYTRILETDNRSAVRAVIHIHRGMALFASGNYDEALRDFSRAVEQDKDNPKAFYYRAIVHRVMGDRTAALKDFNECLERDPFQFDPLLSRSQLHFAMGEREQALADCDAALSLHPDSSRALELRDRIISDMNL